MAAPDRIDRPVGDKPAGRTSRRNWRKKLLFGAITTVGLLLIFELTLALLGVKTVRQIRDPFVGFEASTPLFIRAADRYVTDSRKLSFFNEQRFDAAKDADTYRIFCLGGSTTFGRPYDHRTAYPQWLQAYLEQAHPDRKWQVINCGGISYASYRLALLCDELVQYEPDLLIIYTGHNEFLEERTYGEMRDWSRTFRETVKLASYSRIYGLLDAAYTRLNAPPKPETELSKEVNTILEHTNGPESYHRNVQLREQVQQHYEFSLRRMAHAAATCGARLILVQPASNLRDFSPFKSENSRLTAAQHQQWQVLFDDGGRLLQKEQFEQARKTLLQAEEIDPSHADLLFLIGSAAFRLEEHAAAQEYFRRARDEDVCPLRAPSEIHEIVERVGKDYKLDVIDYPDLLRAHTLAAEGHGIPGLDSFLDHVHPRVEAHAVLGAALYDAMHGQGTVRARPPTQQAANQVSERIQSTVKKVDHAMALYNLAMTLSWSGKYEEALRLSEGAMAMMPGNSDATSLHGRLLQKLGRSDDALAQLEEAVRLNPNDSLALSRVAEEYGRTGKIEEARDHLLRAIEHTPERAPISFRAQLHVQLGQCYFLLHESANASREFEKAIEIDSAADTARDWLKRSPAPINR